MDYNKLLRKNILDLIPYSSARDVYAGTTGIFLDANENAFGSVLNQSYNRYPDPLQKELKMKLAQLKNVDEENIFLGNGSDEAIDLLIRAFCEPGKEAILICPPTYGMYSVTAAINNIEVISVPLTLDFKLDLESILNVMGPHIKLIFICSPNNPTANYLSGHAIKNILETFNGLVVIDEAYIDFCRKKSWLKNLNDWDNLVILQTFSKAWGLAGLRLGKAFANPDIIKILTRIKYPYNISQVTQQLALKALDNTDKKDRFVENTHTAKKWLIQNLLILKAVKRIYPSDANFILVKMQDALQTYTYLLSKKIIVRDRSNVVLCENCLRITVGTPTENKKLLTILHEMETHT